MISFFKTAGLASVLSSNDNPKTEEASSKQEAFKEEIGLLDGLGEELMESFRFMKENGVLSMMDEGFRGTNGITAFSMLPNFVPLYFSSKGMGAAIAREGGIRAVSLGGRVAVGSTLAASFILGVFTGMGLNYLPKAFGAKKTVGHHLGDAAIAVFGPCDRHGIFFKVGQFLGLA